MLKLRGLLHGQVVSVAHWLGERGYRSASAMMYSALARLESNEASTLYYHVQALTQEGHIDAAIEGLTKVLQELPDFAQGHFERGRLLQQANRDDEAVESFDRALSLDASVAAWHAARGLSLLRVEKVAEAEASLRRAIRHDERCSEAWFNLGVLLARLDRPEEAIDCYRSALALGPDTSASVSLAHLLEGSRRLAEAEEAVRDGLRHDPLEATLTSILASILRGQGRTQDAVDILRSAEVRTPSNLVVLATLVEVLSEAGQYQEAVATAERLSRLQPGAAAQAILGWAYLEAGRPELALNAIDCALATNQGEQDITRAEITGLRAAALGALGRHEEAKQIFAELERDWPQVFTRNSDLREYAATSRRNSTD
jgi:tetratricopeptide (TPR) repeat protein